MNSTLWCVVLLATGLAGPMHDEGAVADRRDVGAG